MSEPEQEYYRSGDVLVTNTRAEMDGRTFAMANITAVSMTPVPNRGAGCLVGLAIVGGLFIMLMGFSVTNTTNNLFLTNKLFLILLGFAIFVGCLFWQSRLKPTYVVNISSASGESKALQSKDKENIERIVAAITQTIIERG